MIRAAAMLVLAVSAAGAQSWDGDQGPMTLPSTVTARTSDLSASLLAKLPVERLKPQVARDPSGTTVTVEQVKKGGGENTLWEMRWEPAEPWGPGTWVAFRDGLGRLREVRIILLEGSDAVDNKLAQPGTWVRLVPQGRSSRLDLFVAGRLVTGGWTVPGSLLDVMASSDTWIWEATPDVDWGSVLPQRRWEDEKVEAVRAAMRKALSTVPLAAETVWLSDPQANSEGTAATGTPLGQWLTLAGTDAGRGLGPWGVTLWAADGVLRGWKTAPMTWKALQRPRIVLPGYSEAFVPDPADDPALAINWIRNLGLAVQQTLYPTRGLTDTSADVKDLPFVSPADASGGTISTTFPRCSIFWPSPSPVRFT